MAFSESLKLKIRKKAAFRCCMDQMMPVEIHHIIPQSENGSDEEENAAPLCPNCHTLFGGNPELRKKIREMRDNWYKVAAIRFPNSHEALLEHLNKSLLEHSNEQLKSDLKNYIYAIIETIETKKLPKLTELIVNGIQLDHGDYVPLNDLIDEGPCSCEKQTCVNHDKKVYCYYTNDLSSWVIKKKLYWQCYDEEIKCPRCGKIHQRGYIGRQDSCENPFNDQINQLD